MAIQLIPFTDYHLESAAHLLQSRHQRDHQLLPHLPQPSLDTLQATIQDQWKEPLTQGMAAFDGQGMVGYMLGTPTFNAMFGRHVWIYRAGHAAIADRLPDIYHHLYTALAKNWVRDGYFDHYVQVTATDRQMNDIWFALSFGLQQAYGVYDLRDYDPTRHPAPNTITIRRAQQGDEAITYQLADIIMSHQVQSPVFGHKPSEDIEENRQGYIELIQDPEATYWLAELDGQVMGFQVYFDFAADMFHPERSIELAVAGTFPEARGKGVNLALTRHGFTHAKAAGYDYCFCDWRTTNFEASHFWPKIGFTPAMYRLVRRIDPMIAWANFFSATR
ncbi:MAG: GNAT family N-acetyltransferase [Anaerolineales bacterium]|nr:GNAT family N-acetyltransferase [Anaerolineales bacterium]